MGDKLLFPEKYRRPMGAPMANFKGWDPQMRDPDESIVAGHLSPPPENAEASGSNQP